MLVSQTTWEEYTHEFNILAEKKNLSRDNINHLLKYAESLFKSGLPIIFDIEHLAKLVGYNEDYIYRAMYNENIFYRHYTIPKKNGGKRNISEPLPSLKEIQRWILENILYKIEANTYSKAYKKGTSIKSNAKFHKNQNIVLSLDIKEYFPALSQKRVYDYYLQIGYNDIVAKTLAKLCCLDKCLPQGAPTSPYLSNLLTKDLDVSLARLSKQYNLRYTRYADDITFSGDFVPGVLINKIRQILQENELALNDEKTRAKAKHEQQLVTGVIVNSNKLNVPKKKRRLLRQHIYFIKKFGLNEHLLHAKIKNRNYLPHLLGLANYILHVNPNDSEAIGYRDYILKMMRIYQSYY